MVSMQISFLKVFTQIIFCFVQYFRLDLEKIWTFDGKVTRCLQRRGEGTQWDSSATHNRIRHSFRSYTWSKCENGGDDLIPAAFPGGLDRLHTPTWTSFTSSDKRDFNIIITLTRSIFNFTNFVKYLKGLFIEDILCLFPTLCNRSDAEHTFLLFYVSLDRRKLWTLEIK